MVRDEVVKRVDGAPCLKEEIVAYPSPDDPFFFDKAELYKHHTCFKSKRGSKSSKYILFPEDHKLYPETLSCWAAAYAFPEGSM